MGKVYFTNNFRDAEYMFNVLTTSSNFDGQDYWQPGIDEWEDGTPFTAFRGEEVIEIRMAE